MGGFDSACLSCVDDRVDTRRGNLPPLLQGVHGDSSVALYVCVYAIGNL